MLELGKIDRGWGFEILWANNDKYSGKLLVFERENAQTSMMFHKDRKKTWFVNEGRFRLNYCDTKTAEYKEVVLETGAAFEIDVMIPHQLESLQANSIIFEVGTADTGEDRYRIKPGDSQKQREAQQ